MKRGEVWIGNLNPNRGSEIGKVRPVLVIQDDALTFAGHEVVIVLPLTAHVRPGLKHLRVSISARDGLQQDSQVMVDQPRTLDRRRLTDGPIVTLDELELEAVDRGLSVVFGLWR